jgi:hypothetical protein
MSKKLLSGLPVLVGLILSVPCFAQNEITENQPVVGNIHDREALVQAKLKSNYDAGLIDSDELAKFQRDLDGICVQEDDLKSRAGGMTSGGRKEIEKKLDLLEGELAKHAGKGGAPKTSK